MIPKLGHSSFVFCPLPMTSDVWQMTGGCVSNELKAPQAGGLAQQSWMLR
jgi:hypothetical protein